jgi:hypothetical protein
MGGHLMGTQLQPRELATLSMSEGWSHVNLIRAVAVWLGESQGYDRAYNDNERELREVKTGTRVRDLVTGSLYVVDDGSHGRVVENGVSKTIDPAGKVVLSRDCGICQINIPPEQIGTPAEEHLYNPLRCIARARAMYERRGFQPWVAFTSGIAMSPAWWKWSVTKMAWVPTGRYLHRAIRGVGNALALAEFQIDSPADTLLDYFQIPDRPTEPPSDEAAWRVNGKLPLGERMRQEV